MLHFQCPHCAGVFQLDPAAAGQHVACPLCQGVVTVGTAALAPAIDAPDPVSRSPATEGALVSSVAGSDGGAYPWPPRLDGAALPMPSVMSQGAAPADEMPPAAAPPPATPPTELLGCPRCGGAFQVTADMAGQQMSCPHCQGVLTVPGATMPPEPRDAVSNDPSAAGQEVSSPPIAVSRQTSPADLLMAFRIQEGPKKIIVGGKVVEVRRLTPEEKSRRRLIKRLVLIGFCLAILAGAILYLQNYGLPWVRRG